jgi:hypothetical protein
LTLPSRLISLDDSKDIESRELCQLPKRMVEIRDAV